MALLDDISAALVSASVGQTTDASADWMIYIGYIQDQPDRAICLYETGGKPPETTMPLDHPGFQVRVRGSSDDYQVVRAKMKAVFDTLHANNETVTIGADYVFCYAQQSGVIPLGQDEKRRPAVALNFMVSKRRSA